LPVPQAYYSFVMAHAPYVYVDPAVGPDLVWGRAAFSAAFAIDFLYEAYFDSQFDQQSSEIEAKIVALADWILTQQSLDSQSLTADLKAPKTVAAITVWMLPVFCLPC
jgi:hypothetical protein